MLQFSKNVKRQLHLSAEKDVWNYFTINVIVKKMFQPM